MGRSAWLLLLLCGCVGEDRSQLRRRPLGPVSQNGWARFSLEGETQRFEGLWIGDASGKGIPFLREREGLWTPQELVTTGLLLGRDEKGRPSAEFALQLPEGWQVREREQLRVELRLEGEAPWVARVEIARRVGGGEFLTLEETTPRFLYDLGQRRSELTLPWDGERYRLTLTPTQGKAPTLRGLRVIASTWPEALIADEIMEPSAMAPDKEPGEWRLEFPREERIVALEVVVEAPCAPVTVEVDGHTGSGLIWNLPALNSRATRITVSPTLARSLKLRVPKGARIASVKALIRREALLFPAEAGESYFLHSGGEAKEVPGNLGALPVSRAIYSREPLRLGLSEPDPQGLARIIPGHERTRPWLPWAVGLVVLVLGVAALRILKPEAKAA